MSVCNWIPVWLKVPSATADYNDGYKVSRRVLVYSEYEGAQFAHHLTWYDDKHAWYDWSKDAEGQVPCLDVTHWQELPAAPNHSN